jgi:hypothetical protein
MAELIYELTFKGAASDTLAAAFEDCDVTTGQGVTIVRSTLPDQAALQGLISRITGLGLELLEVHPATDAGGAGTRPSGPEQRDDEG